MTLQIRSVFFLLFVRIFMFLLAAFIAQKTVPAQDKDRFFPVRGKKWFTALPQCLSRACFAAARKRRGCGAEKLPTSATGSGSISAQRKATRGRILWTPLRSGESKGKTRVAAIEMGRGLGVPHSAHPLNCTSDEGSTTQPPRGSAGLNNDPGSAERGRLRGKGIVLLTGYQICPISA